ncbi:MAG: hypothetical protein K1X88_19855 [Nannocystaceae bacterium]|nr:hypothetical protein [Nannocystaceae bacterium]
MAPLRRPLTWLALSFALALPSTRALAEETNPAVKACGGKTEGAPCSFDEIHQDASGHPTMKTVPGSCQPDQCCALDYSKGSPPQTTCGPCLACKAGAPTPITPTTTGDGGGAVEPPRADGGTQTEPPPHGKRGCAIADAPTGGALALVLLACGAAARRRRVRR